MVVKSEEINNACARTDIWAAGRMRMPEDRQHCIATKYLTLPRYLQACRHMCTPWCARTRMRCVWPGTVLIRDDATTRMAKGVSSGTRRGAAAAHHAGV